MIKLYGMALSNYYNMVKHNLLEKGVGFEEIAVPPSKEPAFLAKSPMGKIPCIETPNGFLAETAVIFDYLEDVYPKPALYPADPYARAKAKELMRVVELYVELPARRHVAEVVFGAPRSQTAYDEVKPQVEQGLQAMARLVKFGPFAQGADFGNADIFLFHSLGLARVAMQAVYAWDIATAVPGLAAQLDAVAARKTTKTVVVAQEQARAAMAAQRK